VKFAIASGKKKKGFLTTTVHVPRLSIVWSPTAVVAVMRRESDCGSVVISVERTIVESVVAQVRCLGKKGLRGIPVTWTHTVSPTTKFVFDVVQSLA
jgi:hypothetical protein